MADTEIRTLQSYTHKMETCPVLEMEGDEEEGFSLIPCGEPLGLMLSSNIVGDDYGSWRVFDIQFSCGHTIDEMLRSIRNEEYV